ncbi:MAG TPA: PDZ domain-containing protein [Opitutaceae bacterium]|nr:PDZ domain-containing protein [Opitutaceae bacterium]
MKSCRLLLFAPVLLSGALVRAAEIPALWAERVKAVVAVEFYVESESERRPALSYGTLADDKGTIILPAAAVDPRVAPDQLKDFKIHRAGEAASIPGTYLGEDNLTGWHFVHADPKLLSGLVPITAFAAKDGAPSPVPALAEEVWGIGLRNKDEDFMPYILMSRIGLIQSLPQRSAIALHEVAAPGLPVFNRDGVLVGLATSSFGQSYLQFSRPDRGASPVILVNVEESSVFPLAEEVLPYLGRIPKSVTGRPLAWLGAYGLEPLDPDVAQFMKLDSQGAVVISEVLEGSPAEKAGLKDRDIIVALDGRPLPRLKPSSVVVGYVDRELARKLPGDQFGVTVLRGSSERIDAKVTLGDEPKLIRETSRKYFDRLGLTVREFVYGDAVALRVKTGELTGVVAHFVKPNSPAAVAGLHADDWIREIDGVEVKTFDQAVGRLAAIEADRDRTDFVLLVGRGGETAVLRVKLK